MRFRNFRQHAAVLFALGMMISTPATAQSGEDAKVQQAYELALKCFVAAGHAYADRRDLHDEEGGAYFNSKAKHSWDVALRLSKQLGYSGDRFEADTNGAMDRELPLMVKDPAYFTQVANQCKAYGLM